ncbi:helix-turn-helix domain-containing protein [Actinomycetospora sp. CA-084318]|uniref:helix-turn-helix domain-containing protein n=1 Tax=Actinomycetospora sp. CA-084318 TaxID=3239892 RepID=UPI003D9844EB
MAENALEGPEHADAPGGPDDPGPTARRIIVGAQLKRLREEAAVTRSAAGYHIRGSESKISRMESGKVGFKHRDVDDLLTLYGEGATERRARLLELAQQANEPGWWQRPGEAVPDWFSEYVGLESAAVRIQTYELLFVPGLLQTPEYALSIMTRGRPDTAGATERERVEVRMKRQRVLDRPGAPRLWAVVEEGVLHRPIGGPAVLGAQLDHLAEMARRPNVTLQVLPSELSGYGSETAFTMLRFAEPDVPDITYIEGLTGALYLDRRGEVEEYSRQMDELTIDALSPEESRSLLAKLRADIA